jgi:hypothetical protein
VATAALVSVERFNFAGFHFLLRDKRLLTQHDVAEAEDGGGGRKTRLVPILSARLEGGSSTRARGAGQPRRVDGAAFDDVY